jgi:hypothetical protein
MKLENHILAQAALRTMPPDAEPGAYSVAFLTRQGARHYRPSRVEPG